MSIGSLIIGGGALVVAADIATWCFKAAARSERQNRREFVRSERSYHNEIVRRELAERLQIEHAKRDVHLLRRHTSSGAWLDMLTGCLKPVWEMRTRTAASFRSSSRTSSARTNFSSEPRR